MRRWLVKKAVKHTVLAVSMNSVSVTRTYVTTSWTSLYQTEQSKQLVSLQFLSVILPLFLFLTSIFCLEMTDL